MKLSHMFNGISNLCIMAATLWLAFGYSVKLGILVVGIWAAIIAQIVKEKEG